MRKQIILAVACLLCLGSGWAQSKKQTNMGAPHGETDFVVNWKRYYNYDEWTQIMKDLQKKYPTSAPSSRSARAVWDVISMS